MGKVSFFKDLKDADEGDDLTENSKNSAKYLPLDVAQSREFNIQLIQLVRSRPELYDTTSSGYKNVELRHQEWSVISEKLQQNGISPFICVLPFLMLRFFNQAKEFTY